MINRKRTQRLWRKEGLKRPQICRKRRRIRPESALRHRAEYPVHVWGHRLPVRRDRLTGGGSRSPTSSTSTRERPWPWRSTARSLLTARSMSLNASSSPTGLPSTCAWTTVPSCCRGRCVTGAASPAPGPSASSRAALGEPFRRVAQRPSTGSAPQRHSGWIIIKRGPVITLSHVLEGSRGRDSFILRFWLLNRPSEIADPVSLRRSMLSANDVKPNLDEPISVVCYVEVDFPGSSPGQTEPLSELTI